MEELCNMYGLPNTLGCRNWCRQSVYPAKISVSNKLALFTGSLCVARYPLVTNVFCSGKSLKPCISFSNTINRFIYRIVWSCYPLIMSCSWKLGLHLWIKILVSDGFEAMFSMLWECQENLVKKNIIRFNIGRCNSTWLDVHFRPLLHGRTDLVYLSVF